MAEQSAKLLSPKGLAYAIVLGTQPFLPHCIVSGAVQKRYPSMVGHVMPEDAEGFHESCKESVKHPPRLSLHEDVHSVPVLQSPSTRTPIGTTREHFSRLISVI